MPSTWQSIKRPVTSTAALIAQHYANGMEDYGIEVMMVQALSAIRVSPNSLKVRLAPMAGYGRIALSSNLISARRPWSASSRPGRSGAFSAFSR